MTDVKFGEHRDKSGVSHAQPFYFTMPKWTKKVAKELKWHEDHPGPGDIGSSQDIDSAILALQGCVSFGQSEEHDPNYQGPGYLMQPALQINAGAMLGAAWAAKQMGCTKAWVCIHTNDGDLSGEFWDMKRKIYIYAVGYVYYGTP